MSKWVNDNTNVETCLTTGRSRFVTKEEHAQNEQFLLLPQSVPLLVINNPLNYRDFLFIVKICSKSSAAE